jgi:hypothetical protein
MTKNLFRFSCPASSELNCESNSTPRAYVDLNPKGYHSAQEPAKSGITTTYFVSNPAFYWALPAN